MDQFSEGILDDELEDHLESHSYMKSHQYNKVGLLAKLKEIKTPDEFKWIENLDITSNLSITAKSNNDLEREANFYELALDGVRQGLLQLQQNGIPYRRPSDFFAEMIKPDKHMNKIKSTLISARTKMDAVDERKRRQMVRKFAKKSKSVAMKQKHEESRIHKENLKSMMQHAKKKGFSAKKSEFGIVGLEQDVNKKGRGRKSDANKWQKGGKEAKSKKQKFKDDKYGWKGKGRGHKRNSFESTHVQDDGFKKSRGFNQGGGFASSKKKHKQNKRPGKKRRMQKKQNNFSF